MAPDLKLQSAPRPDRFGPASPSTWALLGTLVAIERAWYAWPHAAQTVSEVLQLVLAILAFGASARAARRASADGIQAFWILMSICFGIWAVADVPWVLRPIGLWPPAFTATDVLFLALTPILTLAPLARGGGRLPALARVHDLWLLLLLSLFAYFYAAIPRVVTGGGELEAFMIQVIPLEVLPIVTFAAGVRRRGGSGDLDRRLLAAISVWMLGDAANAHLIVARAYHAGLLDIPWTLPMLWIVGVARREAAAPAVPSGALGVAGWGDVRRSAVLSVVVLVLVPSVHFVFGGEGSERVVQVRDQLTVSIAIAAAVLLLVRQMGALRRAERLEAELRHSETLAAMGALLGGMAHEIRNPLFGLSASIDALAEQVSGDTHDGALLRNARQQVNRLVALAAELSEYARPGPARFQECPVDEMVADAWAGSAALAEAAGVTISTDVQPFAVVHGEPGRLALALGRLVENAVQHSPAGGTVVVAARRVPDRGHSVVRFEVLDEGPGFRPTDLHDHTPFEPFYSTRPGGTGLGLAVARRIVENHGGTVILSNRAAGGGRAVIRLPG